MIPVSCSQVQSNRVPVQFGTGHDQFDFPFRQYRQILFPSNNKLKYSAIAWDLFLLEWILETGFDSFFYERVDELR